MFRWSSESIEWYRNAVEYTNYPAVLCEQIKEFFDLKDTVYDIGCGLGYIDLLLAPYVEQITGVDVDGSVLELMDQSISRQQIRNVKTMHIDWRALKETVCDVVLACSFASLERDLDALLSLCRRRLVIVKRNAIRNEQGFITEYNRKNGSNKDEIYLDRQGIPYHLKSFIADFGQPFRSEEEARHFISHYKLEPWHSMADYSLESYALSGDGVTTGERMDAGSGYRYYLPNQKDVHIIVVEKE